MQTAEAGRGRKCERIRNTNFSRRADILFGTFTINVSRLLQTISSLVRAVRVEGKEGCFRASLLSFQFIANRHHYMYIHPSFLPTILDGLDEPLNGSAQTRHGAREIARFSRRDVCVCVRAAAERRPDFNYAVNYKQIWRLFA